MTTWRMSRPSGAGWPGILKRDGEVLKGASVSLEGEVDVHPWASREGPEGVRVGRFQWRLEVRGGDGCIPTVPTKSGDVVIWPVEGHPCANYQLALTKDWPASA